MNYLVKDTHILYLFNARTFAKSHLDKYTQLPGFPDTISIIIHIFLIMEYLVKDTCILYLFITRTFANQILINIFFITRKEDTYKDIFLVPVVSFFTTS